MLDLKTLKIIDEALDMAKATLIEENAMNPKGTYVQSFVQAQKKVRSEIAKSEKNMGPLMAQKTVRLR